MEVILNQPTTKTLHDIWGIHGLATFYHQFIKGFSSIVAPIIECLKGDGFKWISDAQKSFKIMKSKVTKALILTLLKFDKVFEIECELLLFLRRKTNCTL